MPQQVAGFTVAECRGCGTVYFPRRLICHACGGDMWLDHTVYEGLVEEVTTVFHAIGEDREEPRNLASVRTPEGICLIVGSEGPLPAGTRVLLHTTNGAPFAKPG